MFKSIVNKINSFVQNQKAQAQAEKEAQNARFNAMIDPANDLDLAQITNILLDEAAKCQVRIHGFKFIVGTEKNMNARKPVFEMRVKSVVMEKLGIFGKINKVEKLVDQVSYYAMLNATQGLMGETMTVEMDGEDTIIIYPEQIKALWIYGIRHGETSIEEIIRQIVRHEFRHAEQFIAIRKAGMDVKKVIKIDCARQYDQRLIEKDAWAEQHKESYRPISEFIAEIKAEYK